MFGAARQPFRGLGHALWPPQGRAPGCGGPAACLGTAAFLSWLAELTLSPLLPDMGPMCRSELSPLHSAAAPGQDYQEEVPGVLCNPIDDLKSVLPVIGL